MKDIESYIRTLASPLVVHPEDIEIELEETEDFHEFHLYVHPEDVGRVIGKKGRIAKAMRTILYSIHIDSPKRIRLTIGNDDN